MDQQFSQIDTLKNMPHVRHLATTDERGWAHTKCGRKVLMYWNHVEQDSYFYTNGTRYSKPCHFCLPDDYAAYLKENPAAALRAIPSEKRAQASRENGKKGGRQRKAK